MRERGAYAKLDGYFKRMGCPTYCGTNSNRSRLAFSTALRVYTSGKYSPLAHNGARSR
ncbi:hypothetical protein D3C72_2463220 [compost metagenome]